MSWPFTFGTATSPVAMSNLDTMFNQAAAQLQIPCSASGTNAISLTPLTNCPALTAYNELGGYRFRAVGNSSGSVTVQYNGLSFLNAYKADGSTQVSVGDIIAGEQYVAIFSQSLNGGLGGFFIESPSIPITGATPWSQPGGRLTFQSAVPVMVSNQTAQQIVYYAPYQHQFAPVYNGSTVSMVNFTSGLSDQVGLQLNMGGAANFTINTNYDLFLTLISGVPKIVAVAWTNNTTRATTLSIFAGFLTNTGSCTAQTGPSTSFTLPINQGTFLGTMQTTGTAGQSQFVYGGAASGGSAASFNLANYYNLVLFNTMVIDNGTAYGYASGTIRQARASAQMAISFVQPSSERSMMFGYHARGSSTGAAGAGASSASYFYGLGFNSTTTYYTAAALANDSISGITGAGAADVAIATAYPMMLPLATTGFGFMAALEQGDGSSSTSWGGTGSAANILFAHIWL